MIEAEVYGVLERVRDLRNQINGYILRIRELEGMKVSIKSAALKPDHVQVYKEPSSRLEELMDEGMEMELQLCDAVNAWISGIEDLEDMIKDLDDTQAMILEMRFIRGMKWDDIARETGYTREMVQKIKKRAVKKIAAD